MKRIISLIMAMVLFALGGCTAKEEKSRNKQDDSSNDKKVTEALAGNDEASETEFYSEEKSDETEISVSDKTEPYTEEKTDKIEEPSTQEETVLDEYDSDSQYWLPVSYKSYYENGSLKHEGEWQHNKEGFVTYMKRNNQTYKFTIEEKGNEIWIDMPFVEYIEDGEVCYDENDTQFIYKYDDNGNLIDKGSYSEEYDELEMYFENSERDISEQFAYMIDWLDEDGNIRPEYNTNRRIYFYWNDTVNYYFEDEDDWTEYTEKGKVDTAKTMVASVWKSAAENPDGTKTTTVYYENGRIGEVIVWRPVSKRAFYQNHFFDKDWPFMGTLELFYRGS